MFLNLGLQSRSNNDIYRGDYLNTPLIEACGCRGRSLGFDGEPYPERLALVKLLLKYNAEVNFNAGGWTALDVAIQENSDDMALIKYLKSIGAEELN